VDGTFNGTVGTPAASPDATPDKQQIFGWFRKILPANFFESLKQDLDIVESKCVFTLTVTTWLMMVQRLSGNGTLAVAVSELIHGNGRELLEPCKQVREHRISAATGAFSQARTRMPVEAARRVAEQTFGELHQIAAGEGLRNRLFLLDGSSIRLEHTPVILETYPQAENQFGKSHWPVARIAVMHHVVTGLAMPPEFGPMYGAAAVSEQSLAERLIDRLPAASVLIADRNFGVVCRGMAGTFAGARRVDTTDGCARPASRRRRQQPRRRPQSQLASESRRSARPSRSAGRCLHRRTADCRANGA
jgi:hypothetical protein